MSYSPFQRAHSEDDGVVKHPLLPKEPVLELELEPYQEKSSSRWMDGLILLFSLLVFASACALYASSSHLPGPRIAHGLRKPDPNPGLDHVYEVAARKKEPTMYFPGKMVRTNTASPDRVYESSSHIVLSDDDHMFYQWQLRPASKFHKCYIDAVVPSPNDGLVANKTYVSSGNLTAIQVWNVTKPPGHMASLSWNTRPERMNLLGTVAFMPDKEKKAVLDLDDGWQLKPPSPVFVCGYEKMTITVEVTCKGCMLEFDQIFSSPPLAFDLIEIG